MRRDEVCSFQEERALLRLEDLERREIEDDLIRLDGCEIRVERRVEGEVLRRMPFQIEPAGRHRVDAVPRGLAARFTAAHAQEREWAELEDALRDEPAQTGEAPVARDFGGDAPRDERPL